MYVCVLMFVWISCVCACVQGEGERGQFALEFQILPGPEVPLGSLCVCL